MRSLLGLRGCTRVKVGTGARSHMVKPSTRSDGYGGPGQSTPNFTNMYRGGHNPQASFSIQTRLSVNAIYPLKRLIPELVWRKSAAIAIL